MRRIPALLIAAGAIALSSLRAEAQGPTADSTATLLTENQIFDANRRDPLPLLRDVYEQNRVLVLGEVDHSYLTIHTLLHRLLEQVGTDPRLKYIVLEVEE